MVIEAIDSTCTRKKASHRVKDWLTTMIRVLHASARTMATSSDSNSTMNGTIRSTLSSSSRNGHRLRKSCRPCKRDEGHRQFRIEDVTMFNRSRAGPPDISPYPSASTYSHRHPWSCPPGVPISNPTHSEADLPSFLAELPNAAGKPPLSSPEARRGKRRSL